MKNVFLCRCPRRHIGKVERTNSFLLFLIIFVFNVIGYPGDTLVCIHSRVDFQMIVDDIMVEADADAQPPPAAILLVTV